MGLAFGDVGYRTIRSVTDAGFSSLKNFELLYKWYGSENMNFDQA